MTRFRYILTIGLIAFGIINLHAQASTSNIENRKSKFSWGLDAGSLIDMTSNDMSAIDISANFGYSGSVMRLIGAGAAIDMMVSSGSNVYPIYATIRTDFCKRNRLVFMDVRGGVAFCNIENLPQQCNPYGSLGIGVTLAKGRTFSSHIILSYNYTKLNDMHLEDTSIHLQDLQYACIKIGVSF